MTNYERQILALDDQQLERFVRDWVSEMRSIYVDIQRFTGTGDLGLSDGHKSGSRLRSESRT